MIFIFVRHLSDPIVVPLIPLRYGTLKFSKIVSNFFEVSFHFILVTNFILIQNLSLNIFQTQFKLKCIICSHKSGTQLIPCRFHVHYFRIYFIAIHFIRNSVSSLRYRVSLILIHTSSVLYLFFPQSK